MSKFYITDTPSPASTPRAYDSDSDDLDTLPYPAELSRAAFLAPSFSPQDYLSTLRNRHQTLEDLRTDLRQRSQLVNQELLDLVNGNYEEFLSLGGDLKGGAEKVEGVRVRVLGFEREVQNIKTAVKEREEAVGGLLEEKKGLRRDVAVGRGLLEIGERIENLEAKLGVSSAAEKEDEDELELEDDEDDDEDGSSPQLRRLKGHASQYVLTTRLIQRIGPSHPFIQAQKPRLDEVRRMLGLDLAAALRQAKREKDSDSILGLVKLYAVLGAESEGLKVLRSG